MSRARTYLELVRSLPRPTEAQVEAFVEHVAGADNWLKLLPLRGGPPLVTFLDPNAGARVNRLEKSGRYAVELLTLGSDLVHGSELPTDEYRRRHGFLAYHIQLGGGTASREEGVLLRALLPEPGILHAGVLVPLPESILATAGRPGAFLHSTFRGASGPGQVRRFRYAVEKLGKLDLPHEEPLVQRLQTWVQECKAQDEAAFREWLAAAHGEAEGSLDEPSRWRRYVEWRDEEACARLHATQDEAFQKSGIPEAVVAAHREALDSVRRSTRSMLEVLDSQNGS
jgi:hypothetical protein